MKANTKIFGEIEIEEGKIIVMEKGMIGFPELQKFTLIFNTERENPKETIMWLQSMDDGDIAFPVIIPTIIEPNYLPDVNEELLSPLGDLTPDNTFILVTVTVPKEIEKLTCNLQAPIIINIDNNRGAQVIVDNDYPIRFPIYDIIKSRKDGE